MGGKDGSKIYFGKPVIHDKDNVHYMYPNEARLRNMNYSMTIFFVITVLCACGLPKTSKRKNVPPVQVENHAMEVQNNHPFSLASISNLHHEIDSLLKVTADETYKNGHPDSIKEFPDYLEK